MAIETVTISYLSGSPVAQMMGRFKDVVKVLQPDESKQPEFEQVCYAEALAAKLRIMEIQAQRKTRDAIIASSNFTVGS